VGLHEPPFLALTNSGSLCSQMPHEDRRIRFPVTSCTAYSDRRQPTLCHMEEIAWVLRSNPGRRTIGFVGARRLKEAERHVLDD